MRSPENVYEKHIFLLLFFEHGYLSNCLLYILEILDMTGKHCHLVNCISEFSFTVQFIFYDKKRETLINYFALFF